MFLQFFRWTKVGNHARFLDTQNIENQREIILFGGDSRSTFLAPPIGTPETVIFCRFLRSCGKQKIPISFGNQDFTAFAFLLSGATSNRKSACIALFLNKLYLYYDVSPLNKVFTTLHRSTQVCVLGSISACKGRYLFGIINISKKFF